MSPPHRLALATFAVALPLLVWLSGQGQPDLAVPASAARALGPGAHSLVSQPLDVALDRVSAWESEDCAWIGLVDRSSGDAMAHCDLKLVADRQVLARTNGDGEVAIPLGSWRLVAHYEGRKCADTPIECSSDGVLAIPTLGSIVFHRATADSNAPTDAILVMDDGLEPSIVPHNGMDDERLSTLRGLGQEYRLQDALVIENLPTHQVFRVVQVPREGARPLVSPPHEATAIQRRTTQTGAVRVSIPGDAGQPTHVSAPIQVHWNRPTPLSYGNEALANLEIPLGTYAAASHVAIVAERRNPIPGGNGAFWSIDQRWELRDEIPSSLEWQPEAGGVHRIKTVALVAGGLRVSVLAVPHIDPDTPLAPLDQGEGSLQAVLEGPGRGGEPVAFSLKLRTPKSMSIGTVGRIITDEAWPLQFPLLLSGLPECEERRDHEFELLGVAGLQTISNSGQVEQHRKRG